MIKIIYNSPAVPQKPYDFNLNTEYMLNKIDNKYIIAISKNDKREFEIGFIKSIFKPCEGYSWDMLEKENKGVQNTLKINKKNQNINEREGD